MNKLFRFLLFSVALLSGCSSQQAVSPEHHTVNTNIERIELLKSIINWGISGKIAFISPKERQSANINWQVEKEKQSLSMTTYLGIQVLSINEQDNLATIMFDGEVHQGDDLELLILQLTGLRLPTEALHYWVKGLPFLLDDSIHYNTAGLPETLISKYDNVSWQVRYAQYQSVNGLHLAKKLTITQDQLTIKLSINHWTI